MRTRIFIQNILLGCIFGMAFILISCTANDIKQVDKITKTDNSPTQSAQVLKVDYAESGKMVYSMSSPEMRKYDQPEQKTEFPKGFNVVFFDTLQHQRGTARANYALSHDATMILELKGNVIIVNNQSKTTIETEKMFWDRKNKTLYGDQTVRIITPEKIVNAGGFKSTEDMTKYNFIHPTATWYFKDFK